MSGSDSLVDLELDEFGVASVGDIDPELIGKVVAQLGSLDVQKRLQRQTELKWSQACEEVSNYFESKLKPSITALHSKTLQKRRFVYFHGYPEGSAPYKLTGGAGKHTVVIMIRDGAGLPLIYKGSHKSSNLSIIGISSMIASDKGSVTVFNAHIVQQDVPVTGVGAAGLLLVY